MSKYSLHYFGANGRAAVPRAILSYAKANWEDHRISHGEWAEVKKSGLCEYEQLPVLECDGKKYCESNAINLYLAEKFNLMGANPEENYQIYNLLMTFDDFMPAVFKFQFSQDEKTKEELKKSAVEKVQFFARKIDRRYVDLGKKKYFLGDKLTLADIYIATVFPTACAGLGGCFCKEVAPNLVELITRLKGNELKEFHEKYFRSYYNIPDDVSIEYSTETQ